MDYSVSRSFSMLYIAFDITWLLVYTGILLYFKKRLAVVVGLLAGVLYFIVDFGIFNLLLGTRHVEGANIFWFLLWLSMSYGFTNFTWIWLLLDRDGHAVEWSVLPILGWVVVGQLGQNFGAGFPEITIWRGTGSYHGIMALILVTGYLIVIVDNLKNNSKINILWLMGIGIGVQFAWEACLLLNGIRPPMWKPLVINSLIETNLGMPFVWYIHQYYSGRWREDLKRI